MDHSWVVEGSLHWKITVHSLIATSGCFNLDRTGPIVYSFSSEAARLPPRLRSNSNYQKRMSRENCKLVILGSGGIELLRSNYVDRFEFYFLDRFVYILPLLFPLLCRSRKKCNYGEIHSGNLCGTIRYRLFFFFPSSYVLLITNYNYSDQWSFIFFL